MFVVVNAAASCWFVGTGALWRGFLRMRSIPKLPVYSADESAGERSELTRSLERKRPRRAMRRGRSRSTRSLFRPRRSVPLPRSDDLRGYRDLRLLFEVGLSNKLAPTGHGLDLGDAVRLVIHLDELADDRAIGDRRLPVEGSSVELDRDASGGGFQRGGRRSPPTPPLRAFCALSAAIRFFSALSRLGPFCFGT
jgi:hypothetical protein